MLLLLVSSLPALRSSDDVTMTSFMHCISCSLRHDVDYRSFSDLSSVTPRSSSSTIGAVLHPIRSLTLLSIQLQTVPWFSILWCSSGLWQFVTKFTLWITKSRIACDFYQCLIWEISLDVIGSYPFLPLVDLLWSNSESYPHSRTSHVLQCYLFFYFLRFNWGYRYF